MFLIHNTTQTSKNQPCVLTKYKAVFDYNKERKIFSRRKHVKSKRKFKERKIKRGGVKWYKENIAEMVESIKDEKFLIQIHTILKKHIEKRGG